MAKNLSKIEQKQIEKGCGLFLTSLANLFITAFVVMFIIGGLHDHFDSRVPDASYWGSFFLAWALSVGGRVFRKGVGAEDKNGN